MAGLNLPMNRSAGRRMGAAAVSVPRVLMSWEDWLTFAFALIAFLAVAVSIQQAGWVDNMPKVVPTVMAGLLAGLFAARLRFPKLLLHPAALAIGVVVVVYAAQQYADGVTLADRMADFRVRMHEWYLVVKAGDISNDNLPFVTLVHAISFLAAYMGAWSIFRWHNPWFALVPIGIVLLANVSFQKGHPTGTLVFFLFGGILLIGRLHLQASQARWRRQAIDYPEYISLNALQLTFYLTLALVIGAWLIPVGSEAAAAKSAFNSLTGPFEGQSERFVRLFHNIDSRKGGNLHTFGSTLAIQGDVKLGTRVLFEVKSGEAGLIRGTSYNEYTGTGWKSTSRDSTRVDAAALDQAEGAEKYLERTFSILEVTVKSDSSTVFSVGTPLSTNLPSLVDTPGIEASDIERIRSRRGLDAGDTYNAVGSQSTATADQLRAAGSNYPGWVKQRYLQLPDTLPDRVRAESVRVAGDAGNPYDKTVAIEKYLRTFPYDLNVPAAPPGTDAVDFLLFELKRGYFDYQATAMAVMLRTLGIPSRVAVGYALDAADAAETKYIVRKDDAYSWVEVFFPGYGWVEFNPTQDRPGSTDGAGSGGAGVVGSLDNTVDPSLEEILGELGNAIPPEDILGALNTAPVDKKGPPWTLIYLLAGALAAFAALALAGRVTWNWGMGGLEGRPRLWAKAQRLAGWAGLGARPAETPREWSRRVGQAIDLPDDAIQLSDAYEEARYGRPDLQRIDDDVAAGAYERLRNTLLGRVFKRGDRKHGAR